MCNFKRNQCKHGLKGTKCTFLHPERCTKLLQHGTKSPDGCSLGKKCEFLHPKMCPSSICKRVCFDPKCQLTHVKGTKRKADNHQDKPENKHTAFSTLTSTNGLASNNSTHSRSQTANLNPSFMPQSSGTKQFSINSPFLEFNRNKQETSQCPM